MNTHRQYTTVFLLILAAGTASCDIPASMSEPAATAVPAATFQDASDPADAAGDDTAHQFHFEVALVNEGAREIRDQVQAQVDRWTSIVEDTDLEEIDWEPGTISCGGLQYDYQKDVIDDLFVMVAVIDFDGGPGVRTSLCGLRESSKLPMVGAIILDVVGVSREDVDDMILHGFGHMLGFTAHSWRPLDLLRNASWDGGGDTHFVGTGAIGAFVAAGGANHQGGKVPVENDPTHGSVDSHWRESVFGAELMSSWLQVGRDRLSAITIQALADIGYTVNVELAENYRLPGSSPPDGDAQDASAIDLSCNVVDGPVPLYGQDGRVVRVLRD